MIRNARPLSFLAPAVALAATAAAIAVILTGRHLDRLDSERQAASATAGAVTVVSDALRTRLAGADLAAASDGPGESAAAVRARGISLAALTTARDSGRAVLDDVLAGVAVVACYRSGTDPGSVQARRDEVSGYQVVPLDLTQTLSPLAPDRGGIAVDGPNRRVASLPSTGPGGAASFTASVGPDLASGWTVTVWTRPTRTPSGSWLIAALLLVCGLVGAGWVMLRQADSRLWRNQLRGLQQTSATVAEVATLAQHSLDLGDVLPAVATELSTSLGLRGLSLTTPSPSGERSLFVLGVAPDAGEPPVARDQVPAGGTLALALSRGSRIVAMLRVTAGRPLSHADVRTLRAVGDVLTSALTNAELYSQQAELIGRMRVVDEMKTVFLGTASHELRTPVVALAGYASLLHANWDSLTPAAARDYAERIDTIAQRLGILVEDILDFSRLQSGRAPSSTDVVLDLSETVAQVLDEQADLGAKHAIAFESGGSLPVSGSRHAIERVLSNLIGNAAKYSPAGSTIRVRTRAAGGQAELVVDDEGPGIPAGQREQVFSPFYRGSGDEVVRTRGAGLGLAIVAEFAASMGGRARVEEAPSGGASFVVSYPSVISASELQTGSPHVQA